jgi:Zn-dependent peptidase ImmA (M78 family)/transcriptional regulator with XRE-family HTH domain
LRLSRELGVLRLAEELGIKQSYISQLESGFARPSEELIKKMAEYFGEDKEYLGFLARGIPQLEKARREIEEVKRRYPSRAPEYLRTKPFTMTQASLRDELGNGTVYLPIRAIRQSAANTLWQYSKKSGKKISFPIDPEYLFYVVFGLETFFDEEGILNRLGGGIIGALYPDGQGFLGKDKLIVVNTTQDFLGFSPQFTIAHEGGHYVLHYLRFKHQGFFTNPKLCTAEDNSHLDWQANRFAGELLMPLSEVKRVLDGKRLGEFVNLEQFGPPFREHFEATEAMMEKRLVDLGYRVLGAKYKWADAEYRLLSGKDNWDDALKVMEKTWRKA